MSIAASAPRSDDHAPSSSHLNDELCRLELDLYVGLAGIAERAAQLADRARAEGDTFSETRAELARSDVLSRAGETERALELQREIADRARSEEMGTIEARAACYLASTYFRLGLRADSQSAAGDSVRLLDDTSPELWPVEHYMVLALYTSYDRDAADFELFEESLRRARAWGEPTMLLAVMNNFAWTAHDVESARGRAAELADEMAELIDSGRVVPAAAILDTIAWIRLSQDRVDEAEALLIAALATPDVEPDGRASYLCHLAAIRRRQGRPADAIKLLERGRAWALRVKAPEYAVEALVELAALDAERGDFRRAYRRLRHHLTERASIEFRESDRRAAVLQNIYATKLERDQRRYYQELAIRDPLTGLHNRRHLEEQLPRMLAAGPVTVAIVDVDHFKRINDEHSHEFGDAILRELGAVLAERAAEISADTFAARLGGEEFVIVAAGVEIGAVRTVLERLRVQIAGHRFTRAPASLGVTVSIGLTIGSAATDTRTTLLTRADTLLYRAKREGRNRLVGG